MADTAGRQMGLPLYAVLKGKTMNIMSLLNALPGAVAQGLIWGIMAIGVYITFRILDFADLTVDGSLCTGGAVCIMMGGHVCSTPCRNGGRLRHRTFTYFYGYPGYPFRYSYTVRPVFY